MSDDDKFRGLLDDSIQWPDYYEFKFIIKADDKNLVLVHLKEFQVTEKSSGKGNYISISARKLMRSADEIIEVYKTISGIKGVISL